MILITTSFLLCFLMYSSSPLKMSLTLATLSSLMAMLSYQLTNSIFVPCALVISFSSGMMILFSYCSMMSNHESKNKMSPSVLIMTLIASVSLITTTPSSNENMMQKMTMEPSQGFVLILLMIIVIVSMICMNISFYNPTKKLMQSY